MPSQNPSIKALSAFITRCSIQLSNNTDQLKDKLYQHLLIAYKDEHHETKQQSMHQTLFEEPQQPSKAQSPTILPQLREQFNEASLNQQQQNQPQNLPLNTLIKPQIISVTQQLPHKEEFHSQQLNLQPIIHNKKSLKLKLNPRMHKFIKQQKHLQQSRQKLQQQKQRLQQQKQRQLLQKISLQKQLEQRGRQLQELKQKQIKKFQLKQKLRKLNQQLQHQKQLRSKEKDSQSPQEYTTNSRSFINPQTPHTLKHKVSTTFIRDTSLTQKSGIKSKSDVQFRVKKLKLKQQIYTPVKHEVAFKLIQKMHAQKLKKHEKIFTEMKRKQERQIEEVKRLEEERMKEKHLKRVRQVLYYTPKPIRMKRVEQRKESMFNQTDQSIEIMNSQKSDNNRTSEFFLPQSKKSTKHTNEKAAMNTCTHEIDQQIGLVIPQQTITIKEKKQKHQTLYTEEYEQQTFQPMTEEGRQFAQALRQSQQKVQNQKYQVYNQDELVKEQPQRSHKNEEIIADNQFI